MKNPLKGKRVLVVDDEADLREIISEDFELLGAEVMCAENGRAGFEVAQRFLPHAIVSDVRMAGGDGIELLKSVHDANLEPSPAFFLITGFADITPAQAKSLGARGMLSKPFNLKQLRELVVDSVSHANS